MKLRLPVISVTFLLGSLTAVHAQKLTCHLEWGITGTVYNVHDLHYTTLQGYHMEPRYTESGLHANGFVGLQAGITAGKRLQFDFCTGYYGLQDGVRSIPVGLRGTWHFRDRDMSGMLAFAEGGIGFSDENWKKNTDYVRAGTGYMLVLGAGVHLKLMLSGQLSLSHPIPYDPFDNIYVDPSRLTRSNRYSLGISVGTALGF